MRGRDTGGKGWCNTGRELKRARGGWGTMREKKEIFLGGGGGKRGWRMMERIRPRMES